MFFFGLFPVAIPAVTLFTIFILEVAIGGDCGGDDVCEGARRRNHIIYMLSTVLPRQEAAGARIRGQHP